MSTSEPASQCGARHGCVALPRTSACGRARLSALRRGTRQALRLAQLRAALPGNLEQLALRQTPLLASSSRTGRSAGEAGSEAARVRSAKPHAGTALAPSNGTPPVDVPDERAAPAFIPRRAFVKRERLSLDSAALFAAAELASQPFPRTFLAIKTNL